MAHTYSENHPIMKKGKDCNETFTNGVTNGAFWYELNGGMQDFNYAFSNCFELTIELSCCKFPLANTLPEEWRKNKKSLLELIELAQIGVKGLVRDTNGYPIADAQIVVENLEDKPIRTTTRGEYWRLLDKGIYTVYATAFGLVFGISYLRLLLKCLELSVINRVSHKSLRSRITDPQLL